MRNFIAVTYLKIVWYLYGYITCLHECQLILTTGKKQQKLSLITKVKEMACLNMPPLKFSRSTLLFCSTEMLRWPCPADPAPLTYVNQTKALIASEGCYILISTNILEIRINGQTAGWEDGAVGWRGKRYNSNQVWGPSMGHLSVAVA